MLAGLIVVGYSKRRCRGVESKARVQRDGIGRSFHREEEIPGSLGGFPLSWSCDCPSEPAAAAASVSWAVVGRSSSFALSAMFEFFFVGSME